MVKNGPGIVTMMASNSYTGGTVVNGGTLQIGNAAINGTIGSGAYNIASGAALPELCHGHPQRRWHLVQQHLRCGDPGVEFGPGGQRLRAVGANRIQPRSSAPASPARCKSIMAASTRRPPDWAD